MNGKKSKQIRKLVYGDKASNAAAREHFTTGNGKTVVADEGRHLTQTIKKRYNQTKGE